MTAEGRAAPRRALALALTGGLALAGCSGASATPPLRHGGPPTTRSAGRPATSLAPASRHVRPSSITLAAEDPAYGYGIQVGDTITMRATVHDPNVARPVGTVVFTSDNTYDKGCRSVRLQHVTDATCYMTFYSPGRFHVTARYEGTDHSGASVTLRFSVVPNTSD